MQNLLRIGDFSRLAQVSVPTLRHYDELGLLKPAEVDRFTDYRYYALEQLPRLNRILALKDLGLSLEQIKTLLQHEMPADRLRHMLADKRADIEKQLREEQARLARVEARLRQIEHEGEPQRQFDVVMKATDMQYVAVCRSIVPHLVQMSDLREGVLAQVYAFLSQHHINPVGPELFQYFNEGWTEDDIDMGAGVALDAKQGRTLPATSDDAAVQVLQLPAAPRIASITHHGKVWDLPIVISGIHAWIGNNGYHSVGPIRELHLNWRECEIEEDDELVFEIQLPVEPNAA